MTETKDETRKMEIDVREHSVARGGQPQVLDRRLFMQLQVFTRAPRAGALIKALEASHLEAVLYRDVNDPQGVALLTMSVDPTHFVTTVGDLLNAGPFADLTHRPALTMFGRSYATGYEPNLEEWLLDRPRRTVQTAAWPWAIWYPLRRTGAFAALPPAEQRGILAEHAKIGRAYGEADLAHDVRLACHGLDAADNEFVIGLIGRDLHPLSHVVQTMRRTKQTSSYIQRMGPFFVGHALWQGEFTASAEPAAASR
ncbi:MAG: chlorite dismutase family protein [Acidobacteriota bacterium]